MKGTYSLLSPHLHYADATPEKATSVTHNSSLAIVRPLSPTGQYDSPSLSWPGQDKYLGHILSYHLVKTFDSRNSHPAHSITQSIQTMASTDPLLSQHPFEPIAPHISSREQAQARLLMKLTQRPIFWCRELDETWTLPTIECIKLELTSGRWWEYASIGHPYWVRHERPVLVSAGNIYQDGHLMHHR